MEAIRNARQAKGHKAIRNAYKSIDGMDGASADKTRKILARQDKRERQNRELDQMLNLFDNEREGDNYA